MMFDSSVGWCYRYGVARFCGGERIGEEEFVSVCEKGEERGRGHVWCHQWQEDEVKDLEVVRVVGGRGSFELFGNLVDEVREELDDQWECE